MKALPYQAKPITMPDPTESQVKGQPLEEEESTTENNPGVANVEEPDRADEAAVVVECTPPCKEAPSSSRCDHFCISTPNDSEATGLGMENGMEDDNEHEDDFSIADAVGTWLGVDELDGDEDGHHRVGPICCSYGRAVYLHRMIPSIWTNTVLQGLVMQPRR